MRSPRIVRPVHETTPQVFLIARPSIDLEGMRSYLRAVGGESWLESRLGANEGVGAAGEASSEPHAAPRFWLLLKTDCRFLNIHRDESSNPRLGAARPEKTR